MVYQQESEILQSHAMTLLTEYTSLYLSNIIYSSYTSISDRANEHVVYTSQGESNEPWVGSMGKVNEGDVKQKLVYLVVVDGGWGRGAATPMVWYYLRTSSVSVRITRYYLLNRVYYEVLIIANY